MEDKLSEFGEIMYSLISEEMEALTRKLSLTGNPVVVAATVCTIIEQFAEDCDYDKTAIANMVIRAINHADEEEE